MEKILHHFRMPEMLVLSQYQDVFGHPKWCTFFSINRITTSLMYIIWKFLTIDCSPLQQKLPSQIANYFRGAPWCPFSLSHKASHKTTQLATPPNWQPPSTQLPTPSHTEAMYRGAKWALRL